MASYSKSSLVKASLEKIKFIWNQIHRVDLNIEVTKVKFIVIIAGDWFVKHYLPG